MAGEPNTQNVIEAIGSVADRDASFTGGNPESKGRTETASPKAEAARTARNASSNPSTPDATITAEHEAADAPAAEETAQETDAAPEVDDALFDETEKFIEAALADVENEPAPQARGADQRAASPKPDKRADKRRELVTRIGDLKKRIEAGESEALSEALDLVAGALAPDDESSPAQAAGSANAGGAAPAGQWDRKGFDGVLDLVPGGEAFYGNSAKARLSAEHLARREQVRQQAIAIMHGAQRSGVQMTDVEAIARAEMRVTRTLRYSLSPAQAVQQVYAKLQKRSASRSPAGARAPGITRPTTNKAAAPKETGDFDTDGTNAVRDALRRHGIKS